jgi:hypothetical protein
MRASIFTASHDARYLDQVYRSISQQSVSDWEWIVLLGRKAPRWQPPDDERVRVSRAPSRLQAAGALNRAACELASADILVELDPHDLLSTKCVAHLLDAFADPNVVFAYSDFAHINPDGSASSERFDPEHGWVYTPATVDGAQYDCWHSLAPTPHNLGYIWYAPNHVRAFRRSTYEEVGGYDAELEYLDDQELMSRLYLAGDFAQIKRCLYLERVHTRERRFTDAIQEQTLAYYRQFIEELTLAWAKRNGLRCLRLKTPIWIGDDADERYEEMTLDPDDPKIDAADDSVAAIKCYDVLQRMPRRAVFFNECYRVLVHAGLMLTQTPSTDGRGAFQDPSHTAFYNENTFMYFSQATLRALVPGLTARLQVSHLRTFHPTEAHVDMQTPYVHANLLAVKDGPRQGGPLLC